jgi:hypothetical protein
MPLDFEETLGVIIYYILYLVTKKNKSRSLQMHIGLSQPLFFFNFLMEPRSSWAGFQFCDVVELVIIHKTI